MKRTKLIKHLESNNCTFFREGGNHTVYINIFTRKKTAIPRYTEIGDIFCNAIC